MKKINLFSVLLMIALGLAFAKIPTFNIDTDGDGINNTIDVDDDNDGIYDVQEGNTDFDNDGKINSLDLDSDNDGINDVIEANGLDTNKDGLADGATVNLNGVRLSVPTLGLTPLDTDGDKRFDCLDLDSDNDGINDVIESGNIDNDNNGIVGSGSIPADSDRDGIADNADGNNITFGDVNDAILNSDNDATPNYRDLDSDNDTVADIIEGGNGMADTNKDGYIAINETGGNDTDNDGIAAYIDNSPINFGDAGNGALPEQGGNDTDNIPDYLDIDSNQNGITDLTECGHNVALDKDGNGMVDNPNDPDNDGIPNNCNYDKLPSLFGGTSPLSTQDTDGDGILDIIDTDDDNDGLSDTIENKANGGPDTDDDCIPNSLDLDSDGDGIKDIIENGTKGDINNNGFIDGKEIMVGGENRIAPYIRTINYKPIKTINDIKQVPQSKIESEIKKQ